MLKVALFHNNIPISVETKTKKNMIGIQKLRFILAWKKENWRWITFKTIHSN
jgi:hypothetical protein